MARANVKKDAEVVVIAGAHRTKPDDRESSGSKVKKGVVLKVDATRGFVWVKGINVGKKAVRRSQANPQGGFTEVERPINISNVMPYEQWKNTRQGKLATAKG